jgi:hypothetical protein
LIVFPQLRFMRVTLNPALPHSVQDSHGHRSLRGHEYSVTRYNKQALKTYTPDTDKKMGDQHAHLVSRLSG